MALILMAVLVLPGLLLGLFVNPWFFTLILAMIIVPLFFIGRGRQT
jgi:hypothetical protein